MFLKILGVLQVIKMPADMLKFKRKKIFPGYGAKVTR